MTATERIDVDASDPVIDVRRVFKTYDGGGAVVRALRGVDLMIAQGSFVAVTGSSGSWEVHASERDRRARCRRWTVRSSWPARL